MTEIIPSVPVYIAVQDTQPHPRIAIRRWVKQLLKVNTDMGGRWYMTRPDPVWLEELPVGLIYLTDETADHQNTNPRNYLRSCSIVTEIIHRMDSERENALDDWLDSRAYEVECAMLADRFLGQKGIIEDVILLRTQPVRIEIEGADSDISSLRIFWEIKYRTGFSTNEKLDEFFSFLNKIEGTQGEDGSDDVTIRTE